MKVAILNGSENRTGTTAQVANWLLDLYRTQHQFAGEVISLADRSIQDCGFCGGCNTKPDPCALDDDVPQIIETLLASDVIVYAVPVHAFGMASVMQRFIERAGVGYLRFTRPLENKVGGVAVVGRRYSHEGVVSQLHLNMMLNKLILPGSGFPPTFRSELHPQFLDDLEAVEAATAMVARTAEIAATIKEKAMPQALTAAPVAGREVRGGGSPFVGSR